MRRYRRMCNSDRLAVGLGLNGAGCELGRDGISADYFEPGEKASPFAAQAGFELRCTRCGRQGVDAAIKRADPKIRAETRGAGLR